MRPADDGRRAPANPGVHRVRRRSATRRFGHARVREPRLLSVTKELVGLEAEPLVGLLLAKVLVVVGTVVDDDDGAAGACERRERSEGTAGAGRVMKDPGGKDDVRASVLFDDTADDAVVVLALVKGDVAIAAGREARACACELGGFTVDADDSIEDRGEHVEKTSVSGSGVDREAAMREERGEGGQIRGELARELTRVPVLWLRKECARSGLPCANHVRDSREAPIGAAERPPFPEGIRDDRIVLDALGERRQRPRSLLPYRQQGGALEWGDVSGDFRLPLTEELGELADRELLFRRQGEEPKPHGLGQKLVKLPARRVRSGACDGHSFLYAMIRMDASSVFDPPKITHWTPICVRVSSP